MKLNTLKGGEMNMKNDQEQYTPEELDLLHETIDGNFVSRTCVECGSTLVMSDYGSAVCTRCEEPQHNKSLDVLDKKIKKFVETKNGVEKFTMISLEEAIKEYADYYAELALAMSRGAGVPFIRTFSEWVVNEPF